MKKGVFDGMPTKALQYVAEMLQNSVGPEMVSVESMPATWILKADVFVPGKKRTYTLARYKFEFSSHKMCMRVLDLIKAQDLESVEAEILQRTATKVVKAEPKPIPKDAPIRTRVPCPKCGHLMNPNCGFAACYECREGGTKMVNYRYRKEQHQCVECAKPLPEDWKLARCTDCSERRKALERIRREKLHAMFKEIELL